MPAGLLSGHITYIEADIAPAGLNIDKWHSLFSAVIFGICLYFTKHHCIYRSRSSRLRLSVGLETMR